MAISQIYQYLASDQPWESPIGHIVPRDPWGESHGDSSESAIGVVIPTIEVFILLPFGESLCNRIKKGEVQINVLEFIALFLAYIAVLEEYQNDNSAFPPHPCLLLWGDSMTANAWMNKMSTSSIMGQNVLRLFANYLLLSPIKGHTKHIAGKDNHQADDISCVKELFTPQKKLINLMFPTFN